jgi:gas vesicle protein
MKTTKIILGFAAAAVAGAAIGMLLAPEKGSDLQKKIKDGAQDWLAEISKLVNTGKSIASDIGSKAERTMSDLGQN